MGTTSKINYHKKFVDLDPGFLEDGVEKLRREWDSVRREGYRAVWKQKTKM